MTSKQDSRRRPYVIGKKQGHYILYVVFANTEEEALTLVKEDKGLHVKEPLLPFEEYEVLAPYPTTEVDNESY